MARSSKYLSIWTTLKRDRQLTLSIVPGLETRIIKALNKRKQMDTVFQFEALEENKRYKVRHTISENGRIMRITLNIVTSTIGDSDL